MGKAVHTTIVQHLCIVLKTGTSDPIGPLMNRVSNRDWSGLNELVLKKYIK